MYLNINLKIVTIFFDLLIFTPLELIEIFYKENNIAQNYQQIYVLFLIKIKLKICIIVNH